MSKSTKSNITQSKSPLFGSLTTDEKVQVARMTNRIQLPREVVKWLQSLDLSYKIKSISKDVANGFSVAEILSRYPVPQLTSLPYPVDNYYRVNMQEFSTGSSFGERKTNWDHLQDILTRKYQMPLPGDLIPKVVNKAPNAAFEFLILLYKFLTKRKVTILNKHDETDKFRNYNELENMPGYMRPTANRLIRDTEIQRIEDDLIRGVKIEELLDNHKKFLEIERENFKNQEEYNKQQQKMNSKKMDEINKKNEKDNNNNENNNMNEINEANNESDFNNYSSENNKEDKVNLMGILDEISNNIREVENVVNEFRVLIKKNFVESDRNIEMDLKNYSADKDVIDFFFEKIDLCTEEILNKIFLAYDDKEKDFVSIMSRTLTELIPFIKIVCQFFETFYKNEIPWNKFKKTTLNICNTIHENTKEKCDNIFINFCLNTVLDMIEKNPLYRNEMCQLIFALTTNNSENHYNILRKISKKFSNKNELLFYHILVQCMNNIKESEDILTEDIVFFYNDAIVKGISHSNEVIVIKSIYLINLFMRFDYLYCLKYHQGIFKHINSFNWEILSLILIYCSKMLELYNRQKMEKENMNMNINDENNNNNNLLNNGENNNNNENVLNISHLSNKSNASKKSKKSNNSRKSNNTINKNEEEKNNEMNGTGEIEKPQTPEAAPSEDGEDNNNDNNNNENNSNSFPIENNENPIPEPNENQIMNGNTTNDFENNQNQQDNNINNNNDNNNNENNQQQQSLNENTENQQQTNNNNDNDNNNNEQNEQNMENLNIDQENKNMNNEMPDINNIESIEKDQNMIEEQKKMQEELNFRINEIQKCENDFLKIIDHIFSLPSPRMTIKIGFIYLAEVLEYYPELAKKYIKLLIEYPDNNIRKEVLKVNQSYEEYEYTMNCYTERYKFCGAPYFWNQLIIAGIFRDYVLENLERFENCHLLILHSIIIHQEFNENDSEQWINLYNDLKKYLFVALCEKNFSDIALSILNKIFSFNKILGNLLESTFDLFISTMKIIYSDEVISEPHNNMKTLLTTISEIKSENNDCKTYVYKLIKTFAIQNDKKYLKSNLLDLLNSIYFEKRGDIFDEKNLKSDNNSK